MSIKSDELAHRYFQQSALLRQSIKSPIDHGQRSRPFVGRNRARPYLRAIFIVFANGTLKPYRSILSTCFFPRRDFNFKSRNKPVVQPENGDGGGYSGMGDKYPRSGENKI